MIINFWKDRLESSSYSSHQVLIDIPNHFKASLQFFPTALAPNYVCIIVSDPALNFSYSWLGGGVATKVAMDFVQAMVCRFSLKSFLKSWTWRGWCQFLLLLLNGMGLVAILAMSTLLVPRAGFPVRSALPRSRALMVLYVTWSPQSLADSTRCQEQSLCRLWCKTSIDVHIGISNMLLWKLFTT